MYKNIAIALGIIICMACNKGSKHSACGTQVCTALFASVGIVYTDKDNTPSALSSFTATDLRTNKIFKPTYLPNIEYLPGFQPVVDDSNLKDLSTDGDNIQVRATSQLTGQTKTTVVKVSGGVCNCHVTKISGPDNVVFD